MPTAVIPNNHTIQPASLSQPGKVDEKMSYLRRLAGLIAHIYVTFSEMSQKDRKEIASIEARYMNAVQIQSDELRAKGGLTLRTSIIQLTMFASSFAFQNAGDQMFVSKVSEQIPAISRLWEQEHDASFKLKEGKASLELQKLQEKTNRTQSDGNIKEQFSQVLHAEIQRLRSASASGG